MSNYVKTTNFTSKDSLASGNPLKIVKGAEFVIRSDKKNPGLNNNIMISSIEILV